MTWIGRRARRPWVALVATLAAVVAAAAVIVVLDDGRRANDGGDAAGSVWGRRWPLRGPLAGDRSLVSDALAATLPGRVPAERKHALWAGTVAEGGESREHVVVAVEGDELLKEMVRPAAAAVLVDAQRESGGDWNGGTAMVVGPFDPEDPAVALPSLAAPGVAYLLATDVHAASVVRAGVSGPDRVPLAIHGGLASYSTPPTRVPDGLVCGNWLLRVDDDQGTRYLPPWPGPALGDSAHPWRVEEAHLIALAGATTTCDHGQDGFVGDYLDLGSWLPTRVGPPVGELVLPDGRAAEVIPIEVQPALAGAPVLAEGPVWTLALVPRRGDPAVLGVPPSVPQPANLHAVLVRGLDGGDAIVVVHDGDRLTTLPELSILAEGEGFNHQQMMVLGSVSSATAVVFWRAGQPVDALVVPVSHTPR